MELVRPRPRVARFLPALDFGGVETRVALQAEEHDRSAYELHVIACHQAGHAAARIRAAGVPVHVLDVSPAVRQPTTTAALARLLWRLEPDVIHASTAEGMFHGALAANLARTRRAILEEVGIPNRGRSGRLVFRGLYRTVDAVVAVSNAVLGHLARTEGLPRDRASVIYTCAQPRFFSPIDRSYDAAGRPFRFFTAGRLVPIKNVAILIDAMAALRERGVDAELAIAGDGPLRAELEARIARAGLEARVKLLGFRGDVVELVNACDAFLLATDEPGEGCSNALIEAMARGAPLVASSPGGNPEVVEQLGAEWLVAPSDARAWADAMERLATMSATERKDIGERARRIAEERFSPARYLSDLEGLYRNVLARPSRFFARAEIRGAASEARWTS